MAGALAALLKDALAPTLMQTLEGSVPVFVHTGTIRPFSLRYEIFPFFVFPLVPYSLFVLFFLFTIKTI
jgi:hypothetical protein